MFLGVPPVQSTPLHSPRELNSTEQTSWLLFLKYLEDRKTERAIKSNVYNETPSEQTGIENAAA